MHAYAGRFPQVKLVQRTTVVREAERPEFDRLVVGDREFPVSAARATRSGGRYTWVGARRALDRGRGGPGIAARRAAPARGGARARTPRAGQPERAVLRRAAAGQPRSPARGELLPRPDPGAGPLRAHEPGPAAAGVPVVPDRGVVPPGDTGRPGPGPPGQWHGRGTPALCPGHGPGDRRDLEDARHRPGGAAAQPARHRHPHHRAGHGRPAGDRAAGPRDEDFAAPGPGAGGEVRRHRFRRGGPGPALPVVPAPAARRIPRASRSRGRPASAMCSRPRTSAGGSAWGPRTR